jgi:predicted RNA binding protein YcfA (HicA-like mRNA interferase family)
MSKIRLISGDQAVKFFQKFGYHVVRQRGSHIRMHHLTNPNKQPLTIPRHKQLGRGLIRKLLRDANISMQEFVE